MKIIKVNINRFSFIVKEQNAISTYLDIVVSTPNYDWDATARQYVIDELKFQNAEPSLSYKS